MFELDFGPDKEQKVDNNKQLIPTQETTNRTEEIVHKAVSSEDPNAKKPSDNTNAKNASAQGETNRTASLEDTKEKNENIQEPNEEKKNSKQSKPTHPNIGNHDVMSSVWKSSTKQRRHLS